MTKRNFSRALLETHWSIPSYFLYSTQGVANINLLKEAASPSPALALTLTKPGTLTSKVVNLNLPKEAEADALSESSSFQKKPARRRSNWSKKKLQERNAEGRLAVIELERDMAKADADAVAVANAKKLSESPVTQLSFRGASMVRCSTGRWKAKAIPAAAAKGAEPSSDHGLGEATSVARPPTSPTAVSGGAEQVDSPRLSLTRRGSGSGGSLEAIGETATSDEASVPEQVYTRRKSSSSHTSALDMLRAFTSEPNLPVREVASSTPRSTTSSMCPVILEVDDEAEAGTKGEGAHHHVPRATTTEVCGST